MKAEVIAMNTEENGDVWMLIKPARAFVDLDSSERRRVLTAYRRVDSAFRSSWPDVRKIRWASHIGTIESYICGVCVTGTRHRRR